MIIKKQKITTPLFFTLFIKLSVLAATASGMPPEVLQGQSREKIDIPSVDEAINIALQSAAKEAARRIAQDFHDNGRTLRVPSSAYPSIGKAVKAARSGDTVLVQPGIYYEQLVMKDGVKLVSAPDDHGDQLVPVRFSRLQLPRRTLRTIIAGSQTTTPEHAIIDFTPSAGHSTIIDGFTIRNFPHQQHAPHRVHGFNIRGASPVITNCLIRNMDGTGIDNLVIFHDQEGLGEGGDFRRANIKHFSAAIIYNNIITGNRGLGIGCNFFSTPVILGNEIYENSDPEPGSSSLPGVGNKNGSAATIIGNIVHNNPGGGILSIAGAAQGQGKQGVDRDTHPTISKNVVYDNGADRPGIAGRDAGNESSPIIIRNNYIYHSGVTGITISDGSVGIIENNTVSHTRDPAIVVNNSTALKLNRNQVNNVNGTPGIIIVNSGVVHEMAGNAVDTEDSDIPPYLLDEESVVYVKNFQQKFEVRERTADTSGPER